jgi:ketosteroid isomerase-like protein
MSEGNAGVVRGFFEALARWDLEGAKSRMAPDVRIHFGGNHRFTGEVRGPEAWFELAGRVRELTGGTLRHKIHDVTSSPDHVVVLAPSSAERDGETFRWNRIYVYHLREDAIAEVWITDAEQAVVDRLFA